MDEENERGVDEDVVKEEIGAGRETIIRVVETGGGRDTDVIDTLWDVAAVRETIIVETGGGRDSDVSGRL